MTPRRFARPVRRTQGALHVRHYARLDRDRARRVGIPEVVLGEGKSVEHLLGIVRALSDRRLGALISRPTPAQLRALRAWRTPGGRDPRFKFLANDRLVRLPGPLGPHYHAGVAAILTAGTSDVALAEEARALLLELGIRVVRAYDVGVAGLHRLLSAVRRLEEHRPEIYLVFAGREGALPTVVAGLVPALVVGIPTSVGYGRGGRGEAALNAMLQSCAPLAVVNIDASVPAALFAAQRFTDRRPRGETRVRRRGRA
ncbi:MAG: nickel pincer cofactor biosynthesis protein LarB [Thermoplasmata archaeon]